MREATLFWSDGSVTMIRSVHAAALAFYYLECYDVACIRTSAGIFFKHGRIV